jgi:protein TonB
METNRPPAYPQFALRRRDQGSVMLRVNVSAQGTPTEVDLAATSGHPSLDNAAIAAVRQWRFNPATQAGTPVAAVAQVPVRFQLEN